MLTTLRVLLLPVLNALGPVLMAFAVIMLIPAVYSWTENDGALMDFIMGAGITAGAGLFLTLTLYRFRQELTARHGFLLVTLSWALIAVFAAIPLMLHMPGLGFERAYFEAMSCLTTTGATVLTGLDELPHSMNGWRCFLSWLGGMGIIVMSVAILPLLGVGGAQIMKAETSGPLKETRLTPRIAETARSLYLIYFGISVACAIAYHFAGMHWRDAVMHMMTTVSLSGIAAHDASFGFFNSAAVDAVAVVFMVICGFSFTLHFVAWRRHDPLVYLRNPEALAWISLLLVLIAAATPILYLSGLATSVPDALRAAAFSIVSAASTTGYATSDWSLWPCGLPAILLLSSAVATCAGSTGGGLKMIRVLILIKQAKREFTLLLYPNAVSPITVGDAAIPNHIVFAVLGYTLLWSFSVLAGAFALLATGLGSLESWSAAVACITNLGPGLGTVGPVGNYQGLTALQLDILTFLMMTGRLEIFTVFVLFTRAFWRT